MRDGSRHRLTLPGSLLAAALVLTASGAPASACGNVPEVPVPQLNDIAIATWSGLHPATTLPGYFGPIILYNPIMAQRLPYELNQFFQAHEYGHVCLDHIADYMFNQNPYNAAWRSQARELEADAFATETMIDRSNLRAVELAILYFSGQGPFQLVPTHPPGQVRARNIARVAGDLGVRCEWTARGVRCSE